MYDIRLSKKRIGPSYTYVTTNMLMMSIPSFVNVVSCYVCYCITVYAIILLHTFCFKNILYVRYLENDICIAIQVFISLSSQRYDSIAVNGRQ